MIYSTQQASQITGLTLRQLQWWSERGVVRPRIEGHRREWTVHDVCTCSILKRLQDKGMSLRQLRRIEPEVRGALLRPRENGHAVLHVATDGRLTMATMDIAEAHRWMVQARRPCVIVQAVIPKT